MGQSGGIKMFGNSACLLREGAGRCRIIGKKIESRARDMGQSSGRDKQRLEAIEWYGILLCSYATLVTPTGIEITVQVVFRNIARRRDIGEHSALMTHGLLNVVRNQAHG